MKALAIAAGVNAATNLARSIGIGQGAEDRRQLKQQEKLQEIGIKGSKEMIDYQKMKDLEMWEATNWSEQVKQAEKAGLSVGWLMGKGGGSSGTIGNSGMSVGTGQAANAAQTEQAKIQSAMAAAQIANVAADTEKKKAETKNVEADAAAKTRELKIVDETLEDYKLAFRRGLDTKIIEGEKANAEWEFEKAIVYDENFASEDSKKAKAFIAEVEQKINQVEKTKQEIENLKKQGNLTEAQTKLAELDAQVLDFKADLTAWGVNETTAGLFNNLLKAVLGIKGAKSNTKK